jgi:hypothetical protein
MRGRVRTLRLLAWTVLLAGAVGAILMWVSARETTEITRVIHGHAALTFRDLEVRYSVPKIALGLGSLVLGAYLWALGRVVADRSAHQEKER